MPKYGARFLVEVARFEHCQKGTGWTVATTTGLAQFHAYESRGEWPEHPDPYFLQLWNGKRWWEWTVNQYTAGYDSGEPGAWPGWAALEEEFKHDPAGLQQIRARVGLRVGHLAEAG